MNHVQFRSTLGLVNQADRITASKFGEVGLISKNKSPFSNPSLTQWNFFFPLNPVNYQQKMVVSSAAAELFGHIIDTSIHSPAIEAITQMSKSKKKERGQFKITIESEYDS
jgi:hypothetical protein